MNRTIVTALLVFFTLFALVACTVLYYTHALPIEKEIVNTIYNYENQGTFDYTATLKPNLIYNKTTLKPREGTIFKKITKQIDVNFTYIFTSSKTSNITIHYQTYQQVITPKWMKEIAKTQEKMLNTTGTHMHVVINDISPINITSLDSLIQKISQETGLYITHYTLNLTVQIRIEANYDMGLISESFTPQLTMEFKSTASEGDVITVGDLTHIKTGRVTNTEKIHQPWVVTQRYVSYGLFSTSLAGLAIASWAYVKTRPPKALKPEALIRDVTEPYEEIIVETTEEPKGIEAATTVTVKTLEDLIKIADILSKPVLQIRKSQKALEFQVVDGSTRYKYETTISKLIQKMVSEEE